MKLTVSKIIPRDDQSIVDVFLSARDEFERPYSVIDISISLENKNQSLSEIERETVVKANTVLTRLLSGSCP